jgi:integrase
VAITNSPAARAHYDHRRQLGDHHAAALRHLFNRYLGQLHHCLTTSQAYNEPRPSQPRSKPPSIKKYHVLLSSIFRRAVRDRILVFNPCDHTELPKVIVRKTRTLTHQEFERLVQALPSHSRLLVETFIETGMRWGEAIALRPRNVDFLSRMVSVEDTIVETSKKNSPTGERFLVKPYPKNNEPRTFGVRQGWLDEVAAHI